MKRKGFTLVELLVVIAIITVLMSATAAGVVMFIGRGERIACMNNLRQMGISLNAYKGRFGKKRFYPRVDGQKFWVALYRAKIVEESTMFLCPSDTETDNEDGQIYKVDGTTDHKTIINADVPGKSCSYFGRKNARNSRYSLRSTKGASNALLGCDKYWKENNEWASSHGDGVCAVFLDFHTDFVGFEVFMEKKDGNARNNPPWQEVVGE